MVKLKIKINRVVLEIAAGDTPELNSIRKALNMQSFGTFAGVDSVVDDKQTHRISSSNPTGEFVRVAISSYVYDINPFVISEVKDNAGNVVAPSGDIGGNPYYTAEQLSKVFEENYFA